MSLRIRTTAASHLAERNHASASDTRSTRPRVHRARLARRRAPRVQGGIGGDGVTRVGFIGLGRQGTPIARRIVEHGHGLTLWARRPESIEPLADTAAVVASTPAEVGAASEIVGICVFTDADVEDVLLGSQGVLAGMAPGGVVAIHSTVLPEHVHVPRRASGRAGHRRGRRARERRRHAPPRRAGSCSWPEAPRRTSPRADPSSRRSPTRSSTWVQLGAGQMAKGINNLLLAVPHGRGDGRLRVRRRAGRGPARPRATRWPTAPAGARRRASWPTPASTRSTCRVNSAPYFMKDLDVLVGIAQAQGIRAPESLRGRRPPRLPRRRTRLNGRYAPTASQRSSPALSFSCSVPLGLACPGSVVGMPTKRPGSGCRAPRRDAP